MPFFTTESLTSPLLLGAVAAFILSTFLIMPFWSKNHMPVEGRLVVITGGSQGMGKSCAELLAKQGANVVIIARNQAKLDAALVEVEAAAKHPKSQKFLAIAADLTSAAETRRAFDEIAKWGGVPDIVWACAGGSHPGYFKDLSTELLEEQVKLNYNSIMYTAHTAINQMVANPLPSTAPKRHIIFTSSVIAFYPIVGYNPYSPAKAAIRALADGLRQECLLYDINVACVFPGTIYTPGFDKENETKPELTKIMEEADAGSGQTPEQVAEVSLKRLQQGQHLVVTAFLGEAMRACMWGGSPRGSWVWDNVLSAVVAWVWIFIARQMDGTVVKYRKEKGVPPASS